MRTILALLVIVLGAISAWADEPVSIQEFVARHYTAGVPYLIAKQYTKREIPYLASVLADATQEEKWVTAVATLGAIGGEEARNAVIDFFHRDEGPALSRLEVEAKLCVPIALGWLVNRSGDTAAFALIGALAMAEVYPDVIDAFSWTTSLDAGAKSRLRRALATNAMIGLALSGMDRAYYELTARRRDYRQNDEMTALIDHLSGELNVVNVLGLEAYYSE